MIYGFDTTDEPTATAAQLVYAVWRSRDRQRFKVTPDVWGQVERFVKSAAKRSTTLAGFLERLKPRLLAATINPRYCTSDWKGRVTMERLPNGACTERGTSPRRSFMTRVLEQADDQAVRGRLYDETCLVVLLVRDRIERERPHEAEIEASAQADTLHLATRDAIRQLYAAVDLDGTFCPDTDGSGG